MGMSTHAAPRGILVGFDGSPPSKVAVEWAAREAALRKAPLRLVCVLNPPMLRMWPERPMPAEYTRWQQKAGRTALDGARRVAEQAAKDSGGVMVHTEMPTGSTVPILV